MAEVLCEGWRELAVQWKTLAHWAVRHYFAGHKRWWSEMDSEALVALVRAARHYDPSYRRNGKPVQFNTYAVAAIHKTLTTYVGRRKKKEGQRLHSIAVLARSQRSHIDTINKERQAAAFADSFWEQIRNHSLLTADELQAIEPHFMNGLTLTETAREMGIRFNAVRILLLNGIQLLRVKLGLEEETGRLQF